MSDQEWRSKTYKSGEQPRSGDVLRGAITGNRADVVEADDDCTVFVIDYHRNRDDSTARSTNANPASFELVERKQPARSFGNPARYKSGEAPEVGDRVLGIMSGMQAVVTDVLKTDGTGRRQNIVVTYDDKAIPPRQDATSSMYELVERNAPPDYAVGDRVYVKAFHKGGTVVEVVPERRTDYVLGAYTYRVEHDSERQEKVVYTYWRGALEPEKKVKAPEFAVGDTVSVAGRRGFAKIIGLGRRTSDGQRYNVQWDGVGATEYLGESELTRLREGETMFNKNMDRRLGDVEDRLESVEATASSAFENELTTSSRLGKLGEKVEGIDAGLQRTVERVRKIESREGSGAAGLNSLSTTVANVDREIAKLNQRVEQVAQTESSRVSTLSESLKAIRNDLALLARAQLRSAGYVVHEDVDPIEALQTAYGQRTAWNWSQGTRGHYGAVRLTQASDQSGAAHSDVLSALVDINRRLAAVESRGNELAAEVFDDDGESMVGDLGERIGNLSARFDALDLNTGQGVVYVTRAGVSGTLAELDGRVTALETSTTERAMQGVVYSPLYKSDREKIGALSDKVEALTAQLHGKADADSLASAWREIGNLGAARHGVQSTPQLLPFGEASLVYTRLAALEVHKRTQEKLITDLTKELSEVRVAAAQVLEKHPAVGSRIEALERRFNYAQSRARKLRAGPQSYDKRLASIEYALANLIKNAGPPALGLNNAAERLQRLENIERNRESYLQYATRHGKDYETRINRLEAQVMGAVFTAGAEVASDVAGKVNMIIAALSDRGGKPTPFDAWDSLKQNVADHEQQIGRNWEALCTAQRNLSARVEEVAEKTSERFFAARRHVDGIAESVSHRFNAMHDELRGQIERTEDTLAAKRSANTETLNRVLDELQTIWTALRGVQGSVNLLTAGAYEPEPTEHRSFGSLLIEALQSDAGRKLTDQMRHDKESADDADDALSGPYPGWRPCGIDDCSICKVNREYREKIDRAVASMRGIVDGDPVVERAFNPAWECLHRGQRNKAERGSYGTDEDGV